MQMVAEFPLPGSVGIFKKNWRCSAAPATCASASTAGGSLELAYPPSSKLPHLEPRTRPNIMDHIHQSALTSGNPFEVEGLLLSGNRISSITNHLWCHSRQHMAQLWTSSPSCHVDSDSHCHYLPRACPIQGTSSASFIGCSNAGIYRRKNNTLPRRYP